MKTIILILLASSLANAKVYVFVDKKGTVISAGQAAQASTTEPVLRCESVTFQINMQTGKGDFKAADVGQWTSFNTKK